MFCHRHVWHVPGMYTTPSTRAQKPREESLRINLRRALTASGFVAALALSGVLSACGAGAVADQQRGEWAEPGWTAQFRQEMEEFNLELVACYGDHGVEVTKSPSGGVDLPVITLPAPAGLEELIDNAITACMERVGVLHWMTLPPDEAAYRRMLDSRECLIAHGHDAPAARAFDVWAENDGEWNPHGVVYDGRPFPEANPRWMATKWAQMNTECPQPSPRIFSVSGLPE